VLNANTGTVTKIDPAQRLVAATIPVGVERRPMRLAFGDAAAWVANADGTLARIDAMSDAVRLIPLAGALRDVAAVGDGNWVTAGSGAGGRDSSTDSARSVPLPSRPSHPRRALRSPSRPERPHST
jgi:DNA-binding beta-propeller fold protein YncE